MTVSTLVPLPVILPLLGAGLTLMLSHRPRAQRAVSVTTLIAVAVLAAVLAVAADRHGPQVAWIAEWPQPLGISLVADRLSSLMLLVSSLVTLGVLTYSLGQGMTGEREERTPVSVYHPTFLVLVAGISNAFLAGDLFNLFVSFEMLLFASYVLLTLGGTSARIRAGTIYVVVNLLSSMLFLTGLAAVYAATGTLNLAQLSVRLGEIPDAVALVLQLLLLVVFAIKAAIFPLSMWLPDSYPTAPAPVTAVFAGLLTKVGVYAILRSQTLLFPDQPLTDLLLWAALLTMLVGILGAIAQSDIKRMLSFTLVSHIGFMVFGIALGTAAGISGAIFYVTHHITIQTALFLVVGLIERRAGSSSLVRLGGLARLSPLLGVLFFVPAMNLAGIPPFSGFVGKVVLIDAGVVAGSWLAWVLVGASVLTSLLTLYAVAKTWSLAFWRTPEQAHEMGRTLPAAADTAAGWRGGNPREGTHIDEGRVGDGHGAHTLLGGHGLEDAQRVHDPDHPDRDLYQLLRDGDLPEPLPRSMVLPTTGLVAITVALTFVAGPLAGFTDRASVDLLDREPYISAVLEDTP